MWNRARIRAGELGAVASLVVFLGGALARGEPPPAPSSPAASKAGDQDPLQAALRDIGAARSAVPDTSGLLDGTRGIFNSVPGLDRSSPVPAPAPPPPSGEEMDPGSRLSGASSPNWLVDALAPRGDGASNGRGSTLGGSGASLDGSSLGESRFGEGLSGDSRLHDGSEVERSADESAAGGGTDRSGAAAEKSGETSPGSRPGSHVANPLDAFMASWVSPGDLALLVPNRTAAGAGEEGAGPGAPDRPAAGLFAPRLPGGAEFGGGQAVDGAAPDSASDLDGRTAPGLSGTAPPANPFLELLNETPEPAAASPSAAPASGFGGSTEPDRMLTPAPSPAASGSDPVPDFAKPVDDDPLSREMKRF